MNIFEHIPDSTGAVIQRAVQSLLLVLAATLFLTAGAAAAPCHEEVAAQDDIAPVQSHPMHSVDAPHHDGLPAVAQTAAAGGCCDGGICGGDCGCAVPAIPVADTMISPQPLAVIPAHLAAQWLLLGTPERFRPPIFA